MTITLDQARTIVQNGEDLIAQLSDIDRRIAAFSRYPGETVPCFASLSASEFGRVRSAVVDLLPVPKTIAISALERERNKITTELCQLGVEVPPSPTGDPQ